MTKRISNNRQSAYGTEYFAEKLTRIPTESGEYISGSILVTFVPETRTYTVHLNTSRVLNDNGTTRAGRSEYRLFRGINKRTAMDLLDMTTESEPAPGILAALNAELIRRRMMKGFKTDFFVVGKKMSV